MIKIIDPLNMKLKTITNSLEFQILLDTTYIAQSTISCLPCSVDKGDYLILGDYNAVIADVATDNGITTLTTQPLISIFSRDVFFNTEFYPTVIYQEQVIEEMLISNFRNCKDLNFVIPQLEVILATQTPRKIPCPNDDKVINPIDYFTLSWNELRINISCVIEDGKIKATVRSCKNNKLKYINLADVDLINSTNDDSIIAKVTTKLDGNGTITNYFLQADGTIGLKYGGQSGKWLLLTGSDVKDLESAAIAKINETTFGYNYEFNLIDGCYAEQKIELYDLINLKTENGVKPSYVSGLKYSKGSRNYMITAGTKRYRASQKLGGL